MALSSSSSTPKVNLTKYIQLGDGSWRYCPVVVSGNGRVKPDAVFVNGQPEIHREGSYVIDWNENRKRRRLVVGKDALEARAAQQRQTQMLRNRVLGIEVVGRDGSIKVTLGDACSDFLEEVHAQRRPKTFQQYNVALKYFQESCGAPKYLNEIDRKDLLAYLGYIREVKILSQRTAWTKINVVVQLLKANGMTGLLKRGDWPKYVESEPEIYSRDQIDSFLAGCNSFRRVLFEFFWMTGLREQEVQHVTWKDLDLKHQHVSVRAKPQYGWIPKTWEEREVPLPDRLVKALLDHRRRSSADVQLVFATANGKVVHNMLRQCKSVALNAGLNCGNCDNGDDICEFAAVCDQWYLHKFRSTFATMQLQAGMDLRTVQLLMGHKDLASTMRYLKPARGKAVLDRVNLTFA